MTSSLIHFPLDDYSSQLFPSMKCSSKHLLMQHPTHWHPLSIKRPGEQCTYRTQFLPPMKKGKAGSSVTYVGWSVSAFDVMWSMMMPSLAWWHWCSMQANQQGALPALPITSNFSVPLHSRQPSLISSPHTVTCPILERTSSIEHWMWY